jgi:hypothetical protein
MTDCTTLYCPRPGTVPGVFRMDEERGDSSGMDHHVTYCVDCARSMHADGLFHPANEEDVAPPDFNDEQRAKLAEFGMLDEFDNPPPPEAFDARAAVRRVMTLADELEDRYLPMSPAAGQAHDIAAMIRAAVEGDAA